MFCFKLWVLVLSCSCLLACGSEKKDGTHASKKNEALSEQAAPRDVQQPPEKLADIDRKEREDPSAADGMPFSKKMVMIVVDTLRADRLGCYGYKTQPTSPHMDKLASEGVLFEHFAVASPWTAPSFGTMLTGMPPTIHRAGKILPRSSKSGQKVLGVRVSGLSQSIPTVGEMLSPVSTGAIMNNSFLHPARGYARGFDDYDHKSASLLKCRSAEEVTAAAVAWLEEHKEKDFFLVVHYFDPHISYDPPAKYREMFAPGKVGRLQAPFVDHHRARNGQLKPSEEEKKFVIGLYNGEVRYVDDQIGVLLAKMEKMNLLDKTWVALTSDHGEEQFDHGSFDHGHRYEEEVTRVPFILRAPQGKWNSGKRIPYLARHVDIVPTILEVFGVEVPQYLVGRSLMRLADGTESSHRSAYMEYNLYWGQKFAFYDGRYKFIRNVYREQGYMYDLKEDPFEKKKLGAEHPQYKVLKKQSELLRDSFTKQAKTEFVEDEMIQLPEEVEKSLRSLGYIQ